VEDPTTIALNLTFFGTLGVAFIMFLGLTAVVVVTLVIAGIGRLAAVAVLALAGAVARVSGTASAAAPASATPSSAPQASKRPAPVTSGGGEAPHLSADWAAAVAKADARADARARAEAVPAVKVSVRDLPSPTAPVQEIAEVAPLVESATDRKSGLSTVPHAVGKPTVPAAQKPAGPAAWSRLDTGSPAPVPDRPPAESAKRQPPARDRKAG
jgi:hypothetical protein